MKRKGKRKRAITEKREREKSQCLLRSQQGRGAWSAALICFRISGLALWLVARLSGDNGTLTSRATSAKEVRGLPRPVAWPPVDDIILDPHVAPQCLRLNRRSSSLVSTLLTVALAKDTDASPISKPLPSERCSDKGRSCPGPRKDAQTRVDHASYKTPAAARPISSLILEPLIVSPRYSEEYLTANVSFFLVFPLSARSPFLSWGSTTACPAPSAS